LSDGVRIDKWLWAARFYKTRSLAAQAVTGGKVHLNGMRVKPARAVKVADELEIHKDGFRFCVAVLALSGRRGPASVAQTLYQESQDSVEKRAVLREQYRLANESTPRPDRKPDKKARRQLRDLKW